LGLAKEISQEVTAAPGAAVPHPSTMTPRQRDRRERLLDAGLAALAEVDYDSIQVKDVAEQAGVSLGSLYKYFSSKERLFAEVLVRWAENLPRHVKRRPPSQVAPIERLRDTVHRALHAFERQPQMARMVNVLMTSTDPASVELIQRLDRSSSDVYLQALAGIDPARSRQIVNVVQAVFGNELRQWSLGRKSMRQVYDQLDSTLDLLLG
jgi:TetR/AcrR family transcriptional regulator, cholesterol catabolism regulator